MNVDDALIKFRSFLMLINLDWLVLDLWDVHKYGFAVVFGVSDPDGSDGFRVPFLCLNLPQTQSNIPRPGFLALRDILPNRAPESSNPPLSQISSEGWVSAVHTLCSAAAVAAPWLEPQDP